MDALTELAAQSLMLMLMLSAPAVLVGLAVGFMISLFQAVTQIQEQTLTFVPKIIVTITVVIVTGPWVIDQLTEFTEHSWKVALSLVAGGGG